MREGCPDRVEGGAKVEVEHSFQPNIVGVFDVTAACPSTDQRTDDVNAPELVGDLLHESVDRFGVGGVDPADRKPLVVNLELALEAIGFFRQQIRHRQSEVTS
jgi:hypothetical protein